MNGRNPSPPENIDSEQQQNLLASLDQSIAIRPASKSHHIAPETQAQLRRKLFQGLQTSSYFMHDLIQTLSSESRSSRLLALEQLSEFANAMSLDPKYISMIPIVQLLEVQQKTGRASQNENELEVEEQELVVAKLCGFMAITLRTYPEQTTRLLDKSGKTQAVVARILRFSKFEQVHQFVDELSAKNPDLLKRVLRSNIKSSSPQVVEKTIKLVDDLGLNDSQFSEFVNQKLSQQIKGLLHPETGSREPSIIKKKSSSSQYRRPQQGMDSVVESGNNTLIIQMTQQQFAQSLHSNIQNPHPSNNNYNNNNSLDYTKISQISSIKRGSEIKNDALSKFDEGWCISVVQSESWMEKVKQLQQFYSVLEAEPRIPREFNSPYLNSFLQSLLRSMNSNVLNVTLKIIMVLCNKLSKDFKQTAITLLPAILCKFRDKKKQVISEVSSCVDPLLKRIGLVEAKQILIDSLKDKNVSMKVQTAWAIEREAEYEYKNGIVAGSNREINLTDSIFTETMQDLIDSIIQLSKDAAPEVKEASRQICEKMSTYVGEQERLKLSALRSTTNSRLRVSNKSTSKRSSASMSPSVDITANISAGISKILAKLQEQGVEKKKEGVDELNMLINKYHEKISKAHNYADLIATLKSKVADSQRIILKPLLTVVVRLIKEAGPENIKSAQPLVNALVGLLVDRNEANRNMATETLSLVIDYVGVDSEIQQIETILEAQKQENKGYVLKYLLDISKLLSKNNFCYLSKALVVCLNDKTKEVKDLTKKLLFNNRPKLDEQSLKKHHKELKGSTGYLAQLFPDDTSHKIPMTPIRQIQSATTQQSHDRLFTNTLHDESTQHNHFSIFPDYMADLKSIRQYYNQVLSRSLRILDTQRNEPTHTEYEIISLGQEQTLKQEISVVFRNDIAQLMLSINYANVIQAATHISKLCKDLTYHDRLREVYNLVLRWVFMRCWGSSTQSSCFIEIVLQLLCILNKKSICIKNIEVQLLLAIIRELLIGGYSAESSIDCFLNIVKCLTQMKKHQLLFQSMLRQLKSSKVETIHIYSPYKTKLDAFFKSKIVEIINSSLINLIPDPLILPQIAQIPLLACDIDIRQYLYNRFDEESLNKQGFKKPSPEDKKTKNSQSNLENRSRVVTAGSNSKSRRETRSDNNTVQCSEEINGYNVFKMVQISKHPTYAFLMQSLDALHQPLYSENSSSLAHSMLVFSYRKLETLTALQKMLTKPTFKISEELLQYADIVVEATLRESLRCLTDRNELAMSQLYNLAWLSLQNRHVIRGLDKCSTVLVEFGVLQVVFEDEHKDFFDSLSTDEKGNSPFSQVHRVNRLMNTILQKLDSRKMFYSLVDILIRQQKIGSVKLLQIIRKCLSRVQPRLSQEIRLEELSEFLEYCQKIYNLLCETSDAEDPLLRIVVKTIQNLEERFESNDEFFTIFRLTFGINNVAKHFITKQSYHSNILILPYPFRHLKHLRDKNNQLLAIKKLIEVDNFRQGMEYLKHYVTLHPCFDFQHFISQQLNTCTDKIKTSLLHEIGAMLHKRTKTGGSDIAGSYFNQSEADTIIIKSQEKEEQDNLLQEAIPAPPLQQQVNEVKQKLAMIRRFLRQRPTEEQAKSSQLFTMQI